LQINYRSDINPYCQISGIWARPFHWKTYPTNIHEFFQNQIMIQTEVLENWESVYVGSVYFRHWLKHKMAWVWITLYLVHYGPILGPKKSSYMSTKLPNDETLHLVSNWRSYLGSKDRSGEFIRYFQTFVGTGPVRGLEIWSEPVRGSLICGIIWTEKALSNNSS